MFFKKSSNWIRCRTQNFEDHSDGTSITVTEDDTRHETGSSMLATTFRSFPETSTLPVQDTSASIKATPSSSSAHTNLEYRKRFVP